MISSKTRGSILQFYSSFLSSLHKLNSGSTEFCSFLKKKKQIAQLLPTFPSYI